MGRRWSKLVMYWSDERAMCQECCGELYPEVIMECWGVWQGYYVDTTCDIGQSPHHVTIIIISLCTSCPGLPCPTTTPSTLATCPPQHPEPWSPCDLEQYGHHCPYGGQVHR